MKRKTYSAIIFLISILIIFTSASAQDNALKMFQKGLKSERQGDFYSALFIYKDVIKLNPYFVDAKTALARVYYKLGDYKKSEEILMNALKQDQKNVNALSLLGKVEIALNNFQKAEKTYSKLVKIDPTSIDAQYGFANLYRLEGRYKEAIEKYKEILKIYPNDARSYIYIGDIYMEIGKLNKAGGFYRKAVSLDNQSSYTHIKLAEYYYKFALFSFHTDKTASNTYLNAGIDEARTALEIEPENRDALSILGDIYLFKKDFTSALNYYLKLLNKAQNNKNLILYTIGYCYEMIGKLDRAKDYYYDSLAVKRNDEVVRFRLEEIARKIYKTDLKNSLRRELSDYHYEKGKFYFGKNYLEKAFYQFKRAVQLDPINPEKRLSFANIFKIEKYYERYLYELKNIIRDTLEINTQKINDQIEILENITSKDLAKKWGIKQYSEDKKSPHYLPKSLTKLAILNYNSLNQDKTIHKYISKTLQGYLEYFLYSSPKINIINIDKEITTEEEALKVAKKVNSDFYITYSTIENSDSIKITVRLRSTINGELIKNIIGYYTGNDKLFNSLFSISEDINNSLPLYGIIVKIEGDKVLLNIGKRQKVKKDMKFLIVKRGDYKPNRNYDISTIPEKSIIGSVTITKVDELISEGLYQYKGIFNMVNEYDTVVYKPEATNNKVTTTQH